MTDKQKILAHLEELKKLYGYDNKTNSGIVAKAIFDSITSFIYSISSEPVWHTANETPKVGSQVITISNKGIADTLFVFPSTIEDTLDGILKWCYVSDLIKED